MSINSDANFYRAFDSLKYSCGSYEQNNEIASCANEKAQDIDNCSGSTVALNDFTVFANGFGQNGTLTISENEMQPGFFAKLFKTNSDNIYRSDSALEYAQNGGTINRQDIFQMNASNNGGLEYAKDGDDIFASASNFAKADIKAIEKSYSKAGYDNDNKNELDLCESRHMDTDAYNTTSRIYEALDLDGDIKTISQEEYASYLVAIDSMFELSGGNVVYTQSHADGLITKDEIALASHNEKVLKEAAQEIYNAHYGN